MKIQTYLLSALIIMFTVACNSKKRSEEIKNYTYEETTPDLNGQLEGKVGSWVQEGTVCYGLVVGINAQGKVQRGLPVKAKVMTIKSDSLKMKALENVNLFEIKGCDKLGISRGETWWETDGDLFKTKEEAEAYLKDKGWLQQANNQK